MKKRISFQKSYTFLFAQSETAELQFSKPKKSSHFSIAFSTCQTGKMDRKQYSAWRHKLFVSNLTKDLRVLNFLPRVLPQLEKAPLYTCSFRYE